MPTMTSRTPAAIAHPRLLRAGPATASPETAIADLPPLRAARGRSAHWSQIPFLSRVQGAAAAGTVAAKPVEGTPMARAAGRALRGVVAAGAAFLLAACGPPVGVSRVSPREVSRELTRSALNSSKP